MKPITYLGQKGYTVLKNSCSPEDLQKCKRELTVRPFTIQTFTQNIIEYPVYRESKNKIYLPKYYGVQKFGKPNKIKYKTCSSINLEFKGKLRPLQMEACTNFIQSCTGEYSSRYSCGGILALRCGAGKTVCSLYLISVLKKKTIILVHKSFLLHQWIERIEQFLPNAKVGIIKQDKIDIENKDIVIAMVQSLSMRNYDLSIFDSFGFSICDEVHHLSSEVFSRCLPKLGCTYNLGLSATPKRQDGLSKVFHWWLGPILFQMTQHEITNVQTYQLKILDLEDKKYSKEEILYNGKVCSSKMISNICAYLPRTKLIIHLLKLLLCEQKRQILVLSARREHLNLIYKFLEESGENSVGFYVGGMKQNELKESEKKRIVLGTYAMSSEGLDIKTLNTLVMISPMTNIIQSVGRILRCIHSEVTPEVYDICDHFSSFIRQADTRRRYFSKQKYSVNIMKISKISNMFKIKTINEIRKQCSPYSRKKKVKSKHEKKCLID